MINKILLVDLYDGDSMKMLTQPILDKINEIIDSVNKDSQEFLEEEE